MIFYFTGTGNSLQVAREISERQKERLVSISALWKKGREQYEFVLSRDEVVGFVFPVHAWNPPKGVLEFIRKLKLTNYSDQYVFSAATCGDNVGETMNTLKASLKKTGLPLHAGFSVQMPNNYLAGFDVDPKELEEKKLKAAGQTLTEINKVVAARQRDVFKLEKGPVPFLLTGVINPLFQLFAIRPERFRATDRCTGCGICERVCGCENIKVTSPAAGKSGSPVWGHECSQCMACINCCPAKAIQFGKGTESKGRYVNPNIKITDLSYERNADC